MFQSFKNSDIDFSILDEKNPYFHIIETVRSFFPLPGLKILDIGCGREPKYQVLDSYLAKLECSVIGIDPQCKPGGSNPKFLRVSIDNFRTKETFDAVLSSYFFGYVTKDWAIDGLGKDPKGYEMDVMKKIHGMLRPDGISVHYMNEPWTLSKEDLESIGFIVLKLPRPVDIFDIKDGLCVLSKK